MFFESRLPTTSRWRIDDSPEYPKIKRTWTRGLPPRNSRMTKSSHAPVTGLEERTAPAIAEPVHGPDQVPLIPWLPLPLENREDGKNWTASTATSVAKLRK